MAAYNTRMAADSGLLVISDLHLSEGRDPRTGKVARNEDFFFDDDFALFLKHHQSAPQWKRIKWTLIINGDFVDFLQVTATPEKDKSGIDLSGLASDPVYGLKAGPVESVWKLGRVAQGHAQVFGSLAEFVTRHRLVIISGNHDIEFFFAEVQEAFIQELESRVPAEEREQVRRNISFRPWFYQDESIYVEHGHQYDPLNSFTYSLDPRLPDMERLKESEQDHIDLPMGSLFVRYIFNRVETATPFADNIKPATRFLGWFLVNQPLQALRFLLSDGREMFRRLRQKWKRVPEEAFSGRKRFHDQKLEKLAEEGSLFSDRSPSDFRETLEQLDALRAPPLLRNPVAVHWKLARALTGPNRALSLLLLILIVNLGSLSLLIAPIVRELLPQILRAQLASFLQLVSPWLNPVTEVIRWSFLLQLVFLAICACRRITARNPKSTQPDFRDRAARIHGLLGVKYVVMGHTHDADIHDSATDRHYFNTGTWTKVFGEEERVLREEKEFTFLRVLGEGKERQARLLKWEGITETARLAYLFSRKVLR